MPVGEMQVVTFRSRVKKGLRSGNADSEPGDGRLGPEPPEEVRQPEDVDDGDPTILVAQTSGSEGWRLPLSTGLLLLVAGVWLHDRRRKVVLAHAAQADGPPSSP